MKKGLLLSVVASGLIYAGGDIAPVAPVQQPAAAPAACDFYGTLGVRYDMDKDQPGLNFGKKQNNLFVVAVDLGVEKALGHGFGIGAELGAYTNAGLDISKNGSQADLSQLYLTYKVGNTVIKAGRQALPKSLSPWVFTDMEANLKWTTYDGIVVVNTDIKDTVVAFAWVPKIHAFGSGSEISVNGNGNDKGIFALAVQNKSLANTTLTGTIYYAKDLANLGKAKSFWGEAEGKVSDVNWGLQVAYAKTDATSKTLGVAGYLGTNFNGIDAKLTAAYISDGKTPLALQELALGGRTTTAAVSGDYQSGFWGACWGAFGGNINNGGKQKIVKLDLGYKLPNNYGKVYGGVAYDKSTGGGSFSKKIGARVGYDFTVAGVAAKVEYRYVKTTDGNTNPKQHRIRVQGVYKF